MGKLKLINYLLAGILILMAVTGLRNSYANSQKYGWTYTQTTIIGEDVFETIVSFGSQVFATVFLGLIGFLLLFNNRLIGDGYTIDIKPIKEGDITGIMFPNGDPDHWDLSVDLKTEAIFVVINNFSIAFPLSLIQSWIEQYKKNKLEETT